MNSKSSTYFHLAYSSARRQEQAHETRRAILEAARLPFIQRGYSRTSTGALTDLKKGTGARNLSKINLDSSCIHLRFMLSWLYN